MDEAGVGQAWPPVGDLLDAAALGLLGVRAREQGASDQELRGIIAEGFKDIYFQDGEVRALGLSDVEINDIDYLDLDF